MRQIAPDYYNEFSCIAGACRHTCCAGWEIDIDPASYARYQRLEGPVGERVRACISTGEDGPHYRLCEGDRCPFLRPDGLCEMILTLGEEALCQICTDHPRFRNYFADRTEVGLGLCCEAAGALILKRTEPVRLCVLSDDGASEEPDREEETLLSFRDLLFTIMQDRSYPMEERLEELADTCGGMPVRPIGVWAAALLTLERLDEGWTTLLEQLRDGEAPDEGCLASEAWENALEQAGVYFLYRHVPAALEDGNVASKGAFAVLSVRILKALCALHFQTYGSVTLDDLVEYARMYSGEVEYSVENLEEIFGWLSLD